MTKMEFMEVFGPRMAFLKGKPGSNWKGAAKLINDLSGEIIEFQIESEKEAEVVMIGLFSLIVDLSEKWKVWDVTMPNVGSGPLSQDSNGYEPGKYTAELELDILTDVTLSDQQVNEEPAPEKKVPTVTEKCGELGILDDLLVNHTEGQIDAMDAFDLLDAWLEWEGIQGYTGKIVRIYNAIKAIKNK